MKQIVESDKILLAIQFWEGDKEQAMNLARLLADLEPEHSKKADILFISRFDAFHDRAAVDYVSRKFNVSTYTSTRRGIGWPTGCNELFFGMIDWVYHMKASGKIPGYKSIFAIEADCLPLSADWLSVLDKDWDDESAKRELCIAGCWIKEGPFGVGHINGNAFISGRLKFLKGLSNVGGRFISGAGWDWVLSKEFKNMGWYGMPHMAFDWRAVVTKEKLEGEMSRGMVWHHGGKNKDAVKICRGLLGK